MTTLTLRLAAPLQSWGDSSRFVTRGTADAPTRSGIVGLIGAAMGLRRTDPVEPLLGLSFGVRKDQPGRVIRDFQTARSLDGTKPMPLTQRYYLADAVFLAAVEGPDALIQSVIDALRRPTFPLYLGRRSCPPTWPLVLGSHHESLFEVLTGHPWIASEHIQKRATSPTVSCEVVVDVAALPESRRAGAALRTVRDVPLSFDPEYRSYGWREVARVWTDLQTPAYDQNAAVPHDPMAAAEGR